MLIKKILISNLFILTFIFKVFSTSFPEYQTYVYQYDSLMNSKKYTAARNVLNNIEDAIKEDEQDGTLLAQSYLQSQSLYPLSALANKKSQLDTLIGAKPKAPPVPPTPGAKPKAPPVPPTPGAKPSGAAPAGGGAGAIPAETLKELEILRAENKNLKDQIQRLNTLLAQAAAAGAAGATPSGAASAAAGASLGTDEEKVKALPGGVDAKSTALTLLQKVKTIEAEKRNKKFEKSFTLLKQYTSDVINQLLDKVNTKQSTAKVKEKLLLLTDVANDFLNTSPTPALEIKLKNSKTLFDRYDRFIEGEAEAAKAAEEAKRRAEEKLIDKIIREAKDLATSVQDSKVTNAVFKGKYASLLSQYKKDVQNLLSYASTLKSEETAGKKIDNRIKILALISAKLTGILTSSGELFDYNKNINKKENIFDKYLQTTDEVGGGAGKAPSGSAAGEAPEAPGAPEAPEAPPAPDAPPAGDLD